MDRRDLHVHTEYCCHAQGEMEDYVRAGIRKGLTEIGFLAHAEAGIKGERKSWLNHRELEIYWREGRDLKEKYRDRITVSLGLELGFNLFAVPELKDIVELRPWERIGLAFHHVPDGERVIDICAGRNRERLLRMNQRELIINYYRGLRKGVTLFDPDMVCHLDVVRKRLPDMSRDAEIRELISEVLREMLRMDTALEVNTAGFTTMGEPYPAGWILSLAHRMGLKLVLGSDSHHPDQVGRFFAEAGRYIDQIEKNGIYSQEQLKAG